jgi:5-methylcytosine-specific restriction endonuclease McrA
MSWVFVLDTEKRPLNPVHAGQARRWLTAGTAAVWRRYPFTIILNQALPHVPVEPLRLKVDPGSRTTGLALVNDITGQVVAAAELTHRGQQIRDRLEARSAIRRSRRARHTRYRAARYDNRRRPKEWLAPSLASRVQNIVTWVQRLQRLCPIGAISLELVKFDTQLLQNPEITTVEYQQGELAGYEVREYLLEQWGRRCAYCQVSNVPLQIEHIVPKTRGGSDRVSNLTLACDRCNSAKGPQTAAEFGYPNLQAQARQPLKDAAALNTTRSALLHRLGTLGLPLETGTGGQTKWNRTRRRLPKRHWTDAACVGASTPSVLTTRGIWPLCITARGRESRQLCRVDRYGFPRTRAKRHRTVKGFQTGDLARSVVTGGSRRGIYVGRVAVRASGSFNVTTAQGTVQGIAWRYCQLIQRVDGYSYTKGAALPPHLGRTGDSAPKI